MCHNGSSWENIIKKCILCKYADNRIKHVMNECNVLKNERENLLKEWNTINKRKDNELLNAIEYHYYSKSYIKSEDKVDKKIRKWSN